MAESEHHEQFVCSICLDALKEPVTIPCGHSYCLMCINDCWGQKEQRPPYRCPQCRESFTQRPLLKKNTLLSEMMEKLEKTSLHTASCSQENSCVECDVCTTEKNRAVMSCLQCLASFCECHLQPHYQSPVFMKHKLVKATTQVQENVCVHHGKLMEIYCQDDNQCICYLCMIDYHKGHSVVSVESEWTKKKRISAQEKAEMYRAENLNRQLGQELADLRQRDTEISKLLNTDDQVHFLKSFQSVCDVPIVQDLVSITQHTHLSFKDISIPTMKKALEDVCMQETDKISQEVSNVHIVHLSQPNIRSEFLKYFCGLHLDPNTVNSDLILSDGNVTVSNIYMTVAYPDHPERFDVYGNVMCREGLRGRCYWEVECRGDNWSVAVSYKGIGRKGAGHDCRLGFNKKSWRLGYDGQNFCFVHNKAQVHVPAASRIGVYLDHRAGILAFYKISDTMTLIHRVLTTFTEPLYPAFGIAAGSSVTISGKERIQKDL
ncbi:finTRIM family [Triplophysa rosa]|uniref:FinTRIM family n=1 Tax=Triplophysa rosa TaxID=992332 RepID=A0A9W7WI43_TRIRA|nr:finTRIM family [Triplophysa rosa]